MGFGFNIIGFPILLLLTAGLLLAYAGTKHSGPLKALGVLWGIVFLVFIYGSIRNYYNTPLKLNKDDIVGVYRVDTNFYPGKNAQWQYKHFKFEITRDDRFIFTTTYDPNPPSKLYGKVRWSDGPPDLWHVEMDGKTHHIIEKKPTLYRSYNRFYYVFDTKWGPMFFRKVDS